MQDIWVSSHSGMNLKSALRNLQSAIVLCAMLLALYSPVGAQEAGKTARIGYLTTTASSAEQPRLDSFRRSLRDLGYIEGKNIIIAIRSTDGKFDRLPEFAAELVRSKVDVFVVASTPAALAAKKATATIPIVFVGVTDPVAAGLVQSLARPGGNITGFTNVAALLSGKRLELLKEIFPKVSRVAVLWDPKVLGSVPQWKESQRPGRELGMHLYSMEVSDSAKYASAFDAAVKAGNTALALTLNPLANSNQKRVVGLTAHHRMAAIYPRGDFVDNGGLMSYGPIFALEGNDAARHVAKILKGAKPAELPVEQPSKFEMVVNLKAAKQIGLTVPPNMLARADRVIK